MLIALLVVAALFLAVLEVIIPSGGLVGVIAAICAVVALVMGFSQGQATGWITVAGLGLGTPAAIWLGFKILPHTPFVLSARIEGHAKRTGLERFVGKRGVALTSLRPAGTVRIDDKRLDAVSRAEHVEAGSEVEVLDVRAGEVVVRPIETDEKR